MSEATLFDLLDARRERERSKSSAVSAVFVSPAAVVCVRQGGEVEVALESGKVTSATMALALPYDAAVGDVVLVLGDASGCWVVGVVAGAGKTRLALQGNVELRAVGGTLELSGDRGVSLRGPQVRLDAESLRVTARSIVETFTDAFRRVAGVFSVHAGQAHTVVEEGCYTQAKTAAITTEDVVTINGKQVHLG